MPFPWPFRPHRSWELQATAFVDGELDASRAGRFERHLSACEACRVRVAELRGLKSLVAGLPEVQAPRSFALTPAMLSESSRAHASRPDASPRWAFRGAQVLAGAALATFFGLVAIDLSTPASHGTETASKAAPVSGAAQPLAQSSGANGAVATGIALAPVGGAPAVPRAESQATASASTPVPDAQRAFSAPDSQLPTAGRPLPLDTRQANDGRGATYRAAELGLLALGVAATVLAFALSRRPRRS
jgi:anti-sigma factor RsiW